MQIPLLDLRAQHETIKDEVAAAVERVAESQWFVLGPEVEGLEREIADLCGVSYGVGVSSGTDALLTTLMALGVGPGDEVVTTAYSFFATAGVIARLGATPVLVDIDPATYNMDVEQAIDRLGPMSRAVMPVHLYGRMDTLDALTTEAARRGIPVVEDAAQAIGAHDSAGRVAGSVGQAGCFSFFPTKNLGGWGDGGMVVTDDDTLGERLLVLRVHGSRAKYVHHEVGGNFRLDALQAAVLRAKLPHLAAWSEQRRRNADRYRELIDAAEIADAVTVPADVPGHIYNQFVVRIDRRDALREALAEAGVSTEIYYPLPIHLQPCFRYLGVPEGSLPHAEQAARETLALPIYPELGDDQAEFIVDTIRRFVRGR